MREKIQDFLGGVGTLKNGENSREMFKFHNTIACNDWNSAEFGDGWMLMKLPWRADSVVYWVGRDSVDAVMTNDDSGTDPVQLDCPGLALSHGSCLFSVLPTVVSIVG